MSESDILDRLEAARIEREIEIGVKVGPDEGVDLLDSAIKEIERLRAEVATGAALAKNLDLLIKQIGDPGVCRGCGAPIRWVRHLNGKRVPYTVVGLNHFADCPKAKHFKRGQPHLDLGEPVITGHLKPKGTP
jgi:hypothetical protein